MINANKGLPKFMSAEWTYKKTLKELLDEAELRNEECKIHNTYRSRKKEDCFSGKSLLIPLENNEYLEIGLKKDGFKNLKILSEFRARSMKRVSPKVGLFEVAAYVNKKYEAVSVYDIEMGFL